MSEVWSVKADDIKESTVRLLKLTGFEPPAGSRVLIKPNLVEPRPPSTGVTAHPEIVAGIIEYLRALANYDIVLGEGSSAFLKNSVDTFKVCGYEPLLARYGVPFLDLKHQPSVKKRIDGRTVEIAKPALEADVVVSVPVLKVHQNTTLTLGLKNMKGCVTDGEKNRFHTIDLDQAIVDVNRFLKVGLCVMDAVVGIRKGTCVSGEPLNLGMILAGMDVVAVDAVSAALVGLEPGSIRHIALAERCGLGVAELGRIEFHGTGSRKRATAEPLSLAKFEGVRDAGACSACAAALVVALEKLRAVPKVPILVGPHKDGEGLLVGKCPRGRGKRVPGCPPKALDILKGLKG